MTETIEDFVMRIVDDHYVRTGDEPDSVALNPIDLREAAARIKETAQREIQAAGTRLAVFNAIGATPLVASEDVPRGCVQLRSGGRIATMWFRDP